MDTCVLVNINRVEVARDIGKSVFFVEAACLCSRERGAKPLATLRIAAFEHRGNSQKKTRVCGFSLYYPLAPVIAVWQTPRQNPWLLRR